MYPDLFPAWFVREDFLLAIAGADIAQKFAPEKALGKLGELMVIETGNTEIYTIKNSMRKIVMLLSPGQDCTSKATLGRSPRLGVMLGKEKYHLKKYLPGKLSVPPLLPVI